MFAWRNLKRETVEMRSKEYMQEACSRCEKLERADCSEGKLRLEVHRMDTIALAQLRKR